MKSVELRDSAEARPFLVQGLWLQAVSKPVPESVRPALDWALEILAGGNPLPPIGFVADLGNLAFGVARNLQRGKDAIDLPGWPQTLARSYEDHVLGKALADWTLERGFDALARYNGRDRAKGLDYIVRQIRERANLGGVLFSPAILRSLRDVPASELLAQGYESFTNNGPMPLLVTQYEQLVRGFRGTAELLAPEDWIALEQRTALAELGQYIAHRQVLQQTGRIEARLPSRPLRPLANRREVPTRVLDEDQYPVGGYSSISTRGSIESLLHSQLAFMENERPDLFEMKFLRDELFYYSRDENQFLRRRRGFAILLGPDLVQARFKDATLPVQRIVLVLAAILAIVRRLTDWLSHDAIHFEFLFVQPTGGNGLQHERELLELLLHESIERGEVRMQLVESFAAAETVCAEFARISPLHVAIVATELVPFEVKGTVVSQFTVNGPKPILMDGNGTVADFPDDDDAEAWATAVELWLRLWV